MVRPGPGTSLGLRRSAVLLDLRTIARRLGLVTIDQMLTALIWSVENPPGEIRIVDVRRIRELEHLKAF